MTDRASIRCDRPATLVVCVALGACGGASTQRDAPGAIVLDEISLSSCPERDPELTPIEARPVNERLTLRIDPGGGLVGAPEVESGDPELSACALERLDGLRVDGYSTEEEASYRFHLLVSPH